MILACCGASVAIGFKPALAILVVGGFATTVVGLVRPEIGLLGLGVLCTLEPLAQPLLFTGGLWRWHTVDYGLSLVAVGFAPLLLGLNDARNRLVQAFAVLLGLEVLISPDWYSGLQDVAGVVGLFGIVVYCVRAGSDVAVWRWLGLVCGTTASAAGIAFFAQQATLPPINPNAWAFLPLTGLFGICLAYPVSRPRLRDQIVLALLASANYALVFLSGSRGALLSASGCGLFLLILTRRMRHRWLVAFSAALAAVVITTQFTDLQTRAIGRITLLFDRQRSLDMRTSGRSELLIAGWNMFLEHPLGVGTGGFAETRLDLVNRPGPESSSFRPQRPMQAHAGWIKILVENGLPGIVLMAAYVFSFAVAGWRSRNRDLAMLGFLATLSFGLGFISNEYQGKGVWLLAAGVMVLLRPGSVLTRQTVPSA